MVLPRRGQTRVRTHRVHRSREARGGMHGRYEVYVRIGLPSPSRPPTSSQRDGSESRHGPTRPRRLLLYWIQRDQEIVGGSDAEEEVGLERLFVDVGRKWEG